MLGKIEIFAVIIFLVILFYLVISLGWMGVIQRAITALLPSRASDRLDPGMHRLSV